MFAEYRGLWSGRRAGRRSRFLFFFVSEIQRCDDLSSIQSIYVERGVHMELKKNIISSFFPSHHATETRPKVRLSYHDGSAWMEFVVDGGRSVCVYEMKCSSIVTASVEFTTTMAIAEPGRRVLAPLHCRCRPRPFRLSSVQNNSMGRSQLSILLGPFPRTNQRSMKIPDQHSALQVLALD